jgi:hypothetical protein
MAVTTPKRRRRRETKVKRISSREERRMRTRFGRVVEEILEGREGLVRRLDDVSALEMVIT